eukprot:1146871-Pelagomonas_calceolata.AAC.1
MKEKETHWLKRAISPLHHKAGTKRASGDLEGFWKHLALEPGCEEYACFHCTPSGTSYRLQEKGRPPVKTVDC